MIKIALIVAGIASAISMSAQAETRLTLGDSYQLQHHINHQGVVPWMERVTELSNNEIKFDHFPGQQLGKFADLPALLESGVADIVQIGSGLMSGDYPLTGVAALPGFSTSAEQTTHAFNAMLRKEGPLREEYTGKGLHPLFYFCFPNTEIAFRSKQVLKPEDLAGLKVRTNNELQANVIRAYQGNPVNLPSTDLYTSIERGTIDGAMIPYSSMKSYGFPEAADYATGGIPMGATCLGYAMMETTWQQLPEEVKAVLEQASTEIIDSFSKFLDEDSDRSIEAIEAEGMKVTVVAPEELERWIAPLSSIPEQWIAEMTGKGLEGQKVVDMWLETLSSM